MMWAQAVAELRRMVTTEMRKQLTQLIGFTTVGRSSAIGNEDAVQKSDAAGDGQRPAQRMEPWGFRGRPPAKVRGLWLRLGSSNIAFIGVMPSGAYGPQDLSEGDSAQFCSGAAEVRCAGDDVTVNGGSKDVARVDDDAKAGTQMATWMGQVEGFINAATPGTVTPLAATFSTMPGIAVIRTGAPHFKG